MLKVILITIGIIAEFLIGNEKPNNICLGVYYFDGWTGKTAGTTSQRLVQQFPDREPIWGWQTSTPEIMEKQIALASSSGISFFNFCWYYPNDTNSTYHSLPLNNAVKLYLNSPNKSLLKFSLLIANHSGFLIYPKDWNQVSNAWIELFKDKNYLMVEGKPYLTIFDLRSLIKCFGSTDAVRTALDELRSTAQKAGFEGVTIATCVSVQDASSSLAAKLCGFDILTGYNYPNAGYNNAGNSNSIKELTKGEIQIWNKLKGSGKPYVPVSTLNWDARPWAKDDNDLMQKKYYTGYSKESVKQSIIQLRRWMKENNSFTTKENIAMAYAWNEYGEGGWLTPSKYKDKALLSGLKEGLRLPL